MKIFAVLFLSLFLTDSQAQHFIEDISMGFIDTPKVEMAPLTVENLQGVWKRANRRRYDLAGDEMYETVIDYRHIYIEGNKIWEFEYPSQMYSVSTFEIKDSAIHIISNKSFLNKLMEPELLFGSSGVCHYGVRSDLQVLCFGGDNYYKDSLDIKVINKLKSGKFNADCLIGNWKLKTFYDTGYDGNGIVDIIHPWKLPKYLNIKNGDVHRYYGGHRFYLKVDGVKRPFIIHEIHRSDWSSELVLTPDSWYKEPDGDPYEDEPFIGYHSSTVIYMINDPDERW